MGGVPIVTLLTGDAKAHAGYGGPASLRYCGATFRTLAEGFTLRQAALGSTYAVLYGRVNLLVDRVVSCPAGSHLALLKKISLQKGDTGGKWLLLKQDVSNDTKRPSASAASDCVTRGLSCFTAVGPTT